MELDPPPGETLDDSSDLRSFLIADVRGYTRFTNEHGDEAAAQLTGRFAELTRDAVAASGGALLELRGDEALCVFPSARRAIRAAIQLQRRFLERVDGEPVIPLGVGMGLDAGEAVPTEGGYRGGALNLAARLCSIALPGQILASEAIVHLAQHVPGVAFHPRKRVRLKGLDRPVQVIEIVPEEPLPQPPAASRAPSPSDRRRHRCGRDRCGCHCRHSRVALLNVWEIGVDPRQLGSGDRCRVERRWRAGRGGDVARRRGCRRGFRLGAERRRSDGVAH